VSSTFASTRCPSAILGLVLSLFLCEPSSGESDEWFDPQTLRCLVLLERDATPEPTPLGTGFLALTPGPGPVAIVITAKHLLNRPSICVSVPAETSFVAYCSNNQLRCDSLQVQGYTWDLDGSKLRCRVSLRDCSRDLVVSHPDSGLDIAAFPLEIPKWLTVNGDTVLVSKCLLLGPGYFLNRETIPLGTRTYFLGFPMGLGAGDCISPVLRSGSVAYIDHFGKEFWLDSVSMGGNSGSPVFTGSERTVSLRYSPPQIVGMVVGHFCEHRTFLEEVSTPKGMVVVSAPAELENWGLARAIWAKDILVLLESIASDSGDDLGDQ